MSALVGHPLRNFNSTLAATHAEVYRNFHFSNDHATASNDRVNDATAAAHIKISDGQGGGHTSIISSHANTSGRPQTVLHGDISFAAGATLAGLPSGTATSGDQQFQNTARLSKYIIS